MAASGPDDAGLGARLESVEAKLANVEAASGRVKNTGRIMTIVIAVVVIVLVWFLISPFYTATQNPEPYVQQLQADMESQLLPMLEEEGKVLATDLRPVLESQMESFQSQHAPRLISMLESEANVLIQNVVVEVDNEMEVFQQEYQQKQLERLRTEMPGIDDPEKVDRFLTVAENVSARMVEELFSDHYDALIRLEAAFAAVEVPEEVASMSPEELEEHVSALLMEYLALRYNQIAQGTTPEGGTASEMISPVTVE